MQESLEREERPPDSEADHYIEIIMMQSQTIPGPIPIGSLGSYWILSDWLQALSGSYRILSDWKAYRPKFIQYFNAYRQDLSVIFHLHSHFSKIARVAPGAIDRAAKPF